MGRKRQKADLRELDQTSPEYWEEVLRRHNLPMYRGMHPHLSYGAEYFDHGDGESVTDPSD